MDNILDQIAALEQKIAELPIGSVTKKTVNGHVYYYYRCRENGVRIRHSTEVVPQQYRHLIDEKKCADTEHRFGPITEKYILYRGEDLDLEDGICYRNVEEYLRQLR